MALPEPAPVVPSPGWGGGGPSRVAATAPGAARADDLPNGSPDVAKARRAARDSARLGERCRAPQGYRVPVVDPNYCEGVSDCVAVCPYSVFELGTLTEEEFRSLSFFGRVRARAHDRRTSRIPHASACRACGLCVAAGPESSITLRRV